MSFLPALTLLFAPAYSLRFSLFGLPTNLLMAWTAAVWIIAAIKFSQNHHWGLFLSYVKNRDRKILWLSALFFSAGLIALFTGGFSQEKLGQFIVLILQPLSLFFLFGYIFQKQPAAKSSLLLAAYCLLALMGAVAVAQYFTLFGLPAEFWGNNIEPKRATSVFGHPNFYALFSAPLLAFLIPDVFASLKTKGRYPKAALWLIGAIGLFFSMSRAGWLGLAAAAGIYALFFADRKVRKTIFALAVVFVLVIAAVPNWRYRFILPFYREKSSISRISLWQTGSKAVKEAPVTGLGLTGFGHAWDRLNTDANLDKHNFPHNIFLDAWVELGLAGLASLTGLMGLYLFRGFKKHNSPAAGKEEQEVAGFSRLLPLGISLFLAALIIQGLIDNPYFKNDLALVFWTILSLI